MLVTRVARGLRCYWEYFSSCDNIVLGILANCEHALQHAPRGDLGRQADLLQSSSTIKSPKSQGYKTQDK
jgi:hypothetical protein